MAISRPFDHSLFIQSVTTSGGSDNLAKGQLAIVDLMQNTSNGAAVVSDFAGFPKNDKRFAFRIGRGGKQANRSYSNQAMSNFPFSLNEVEKVTISVPTRTEQSVDELTIGFDGFDPTTAFKFKRGQAPFVLTVELSGGALQYRGGGHSDVEVINIIKEIDAWDPYDTCDEPDTCAPVACQPILSDIIERLKRKELAAGVKVEDVVEVNPVIKCDDTSETGTTAYTYYTLTLCDTGDDEALNFVQSQYAFPVKVLSRSGSNTTYQVFAATAPGDYVQTIPSILKGCDECPDGYDEVEGGYVYAITIVDGGADASSTITTNLANAKYVSGTIDKQGNSGSTGFYTALYTSPITASEISTFVGSTANNRATATVSLVGEKEAFCNNGTETTIEWVAGDSCNATTQTYSIVLPDTKCGDDRLTELRNRYGNSVVIGDSSEFSTLELTLTGTSGTAQIAVGSSSYTATFASDLTTTANNFVTTHAAAILEAGVVVTANAGVLTFEGSNTLLESVGITNATLTLDGDLGDLEPTEDRKACQTRYELPVITNFVCEECDPVFKAFWTSEAPEPFDNKEWTLISGDVNADENCLCGIKIKGKTFVISAEEALRDMAGFTETSVKVRASAGYSLEIREGIGYIDRGIYRANYLSRFIPRTHLMGNLRKLEQESRALFLNEQYSSSYMKRVLRAEESVIQDNLQQVAQVTVRVRHNNLSQSLGGVHIEPIEYHFTAPLGSHQPLVDLVNALGAASGAGVI